MELSEHPPFGKNAGQQTVKLGSQWTADRVKKFGQTKLWANSVVFITWDDWGGWYDHVDPPPMPKAPVQSKWTGKGPAKGPSHTNTQFSYGTRVACLVISPYSKRGISKVFHSHVSLVKFCEVTFGLKPINARDTASDDMSDCFDFKQTPLQPPS